MHSIYQKWQRLLKCATKSISIKCCSFKISTHFSTKKYASQFSQKSYNTLIINVSSAPNQHIRMISWGLCDTQDWSNGWWWNFFQKLFFFNLTILTTYFKYKCTINKNNFAQICAKILFKIVKYFRIYSKGYSSMHLWWCPVRLM